MASEIGHVKSTEGAVKVIGADGIEKVVVAGEAIFENDVVVTGVAGSAVLSLENGHTIEVGADEQLSLDSSVSAEAAPDDAVLDDVASLQAALLAGEELEATAAGISGGGGGGISGLSNGAVYDLRTDDRSDVKADQLPDEFARAFPETKAEIQVGELPEEEIPEPMIPEPVIPEPVAPVAQAPVAPEPVAPEPVIPEPVTLVPDNDTVQVDEAALSFGSNPGSTDETITGDLDVPGAVNYALNGSGDGTYGTLTITNAATGTYEYVLDTQYDNPDADDGVQVIQGVENFTYTATDAFGNSVDGTITIDIVDDVPSIDVEVDSETTEPTLIVDETQLGSGQTQGGLIPTPADTPFTLVSPTGYELPTGVTAVGGIVVDIIGLSGARLVTQVAASDLYEGYFTTSGNYEGASGGINPGIIGEQTGITQEMLDALGGGFSEVAVRVTVWDGDTSPGNFDVNDDTLLLNGVNIGDWTNVTTIETDSLGNPTSASSAGFSNNDLDTGWFSTTDTASLEGLYNSLVASNTIEFQLNDVDPGDNYFDFTQGVDASLQDLGLPPTITTGNSDTQDFSGSFSSIMDPGADGAASVITTYELGITSTTDSGLVDTESGEKVILSIDANGNVEGRTESGDELVFTVSTDNDGNVTLDQARAMEHPIPGDGKEVAPVVNSHDEPATTMIDNLITLTREDTITDNDGDTATDSATLNIGANLTFLDDGPTAEAEVEATASVDLDETTDTTADTGLGVAATITATAIEDLFAEVTADSYGADGEGDVSYSLTATNFVGTGLYLAGAEQTTGNEIQLVEVKTDDIVTGYEGLVGGAGGTLAFTVGIETDSGEVKVTQSEAMEHETDGSDADAHNDTETPLDLGTLIKVVQTVTDADGDTASATSNSALDIEFYDDGPTAATPDPDILGTTFTMTNNDYESSAGYHNSYGYYVKDPDDPDGKPTDGVIVWDDVHDSGTTPVTVSGYTQNEIGFFIIPNGENANTSLDDGTKVEFKHDGTQWQAFSESATEAGVFDVPVVGQGSHVLFDNGALNLDGQDHLFDNALDGNQNWEDLQIADGDEDFNDVNTNVVWTDGTLDESALPADGGDGVYSATFNVAPAFAATSGIYGADGEGSIDYAVSLNGGVPVGSGLHILDGNESDGKGAEIILVDNGDGTVSGMNGTDEIFTIAVDADGLGTIAYADQDDPVNIWHDQTPENYADNQELLTTLVPDTLVVTQTITDADGDTATSDGLDIGSGYIAFDDDGPEVSEATDTVIANADIDTNLIITFDVSGSMGYNSNKVDTDGDGIPDTTRFEVAKQSLIQTIEAYDDIGNVEVDLTVFATTAHNNGWMSAGEAITYLNGLTTPGSAGQGSSTNYEAALDKTNDTSLSGHNADQTIAYFISDGEENTGNYNAEIADWTTFINTNDIDLNVVDIGATSSGSINDELKDVQKVMVGKDGTDVIAVTDVNSLAGVLTAGIDTISGTADLGVDIGTDLDGATVVVSNDDYDDDTKDNVINNDGTPDGTQVTSNGENLVYITGSGGVLLAVTDLDDPSTAVFTITPTINPDGTTSYTTEVTGQIDQQTDDGGNDVPIALNFKADVTDGDGDTVNQSFNVTFDGDQNLEGSDGNDLIVGSGADETLLGGEGDDILIGGGGADELDGGAGNDTVSYEGDTDGVTVDLSTDPDTASGGDAEGDTISDVENITGGDGADTLTGDANDNIIDGGAGNDTIDGGAGNDTIDGGAGADTIDGGDGDDSLTGGDDGDTFVDPDPGEMEDFDPIEGDIVDPDVP